MKKAALISLFLLLCFFSNAQNTLDPFKHINGIFFYYSINPSQINDLLIEQYIVSSNNIFEISNENYDWEKSFEKHKIDFFENIKTPKKEFILKISLKLGEYDNSRKGYAIPLQKVKKIGFSPENQVHAEYPNNLPLVYMISNDLEKCNFFTMDPIAARNYEKSRTLSEGNIDREVVIDLFIELLGSNSKEYIDFFKTYIAETYSTEKIFIPILYKIIKAEINGTYGTGLLGTIFF